MELQPDLFTRLLERSAEQRPRRRRAERRSAAYRKHTPFTEGRRELLRREFLQSISLAPGGFATGAHRSRAVEPYPTPSLLHQVSYTKSPTPSLLHQVSYTKSPTPSLLHQVSYTKSPTPSLLHQ